MLPICQHLFDSYKACGVLHAIEAGGAKAFCDLTDCEEQSINHHNDRSGYKTSDQARKQGAYQQNFL
jgi:hypothetical protein